MAAETPEEKAYRLRQERLDRGLLLDTVFGVSLTVPISINPVAIH